MDHPGIPETRTQVPTGAIASGEPPAEAAMREAFEELLPDGGEPVELELYWGDMLSDAVELIAGQGDLLHMIKEVAS